MNPLLAMPATCVLTFASVDLEETEQGWEEVLHLEVGTESHCAQLDLQLPPGTQLDRLKGKTILADGTKHKLEGLRLEPLPRDLGGWGAIRMHTPEVIAGDQVILDVTRTWTRREYTWNLEAETVALLGKLEGAEKKGVRAHTASRTPEPVPSLPEPPATIALESSLQIPGDPMRSLYPGGGSSVIQTWTIDIPAGDGLRGVRIPIPPGSKGLVVDGESRDLTDSVVVTAQESAQTHTVVFETVDAPTYGQPPAIPGAQLTQTVSTPNGIVKWQDEATWWLAGIDLQPILPDRPRLIRALDNRFHRAAIPEPGIPNFLRGVPGNEDLVAQLRPALWRRAGVAQMPADPLFPRRLIKARKTGALTSVEAALTLWLQAGQAQLRSSWAIVRPASDGEGFHTSPAGYSHGLTAVQLGDEVAWIDPGCRVCAPFEIRPELTDADMLSPLGYRSTPSPDGVYRVEDIDGIRRIEFVGPAALEVRRWLSTLPQTSREAALAQRFGGPGATLQGSRGLGDLGNPIAVEISLDDDPVDPLGVELLASDGWWGWTGNRTWTYAQDGQQRRHVHSSDLCWTRTDTDGVVTETLSVAHRRIPQSQAENLFLERATVLEIPVPVEELDAQH